MIGVRSPQSINYRLLWSGLAGLVTALLALALSALVLWNNTSGWRLLIVTAPLATFLTGFLLWWLLLALRPRVTLLAGALAGGLIGLLAHLPTWYLAIVWLYFSEGTDSLGQPLFNPLQALWAAPLFSLGSWLVVGWLTAPLGALAGGLMAYIQGKSGQG